MKIVPATIKYLAIFALLPDMCSQVWKFLSPLTPSVFGYILLDAFSSIFSETKAKQVK